MAVLRLALDIDSVAHPELYEALASIEDSAHWAERIRHLAGAGLLVQRLRIGPDGVVGSSGDATARSWGSAGGDLEVAPGPIAAPRAAASVPAPPRLVVGPEAEVPAREAPPAARNLPVLFDEVPASLLPPDGATEAPDDARVSAPPPSPAPSAAADDPEPIVESAGSLHMSGRRSRLMRMRNRGLFNNE